MKWGRRHREGGKTSSIKVPALLRWPGLQQCPGLLTTGIKTISGSLERPSVWSASAQCSSKLTGRNRALGRWQLLPKACCRTGCLFHAPARTLSSRTFECSPRSLGQLRTAGNGKTYRGCGAAAAARDRHTCTGFGQHNTVLETILKCVIPW